MDKITKTYLIAISIVLALILIYHWQFVIFGTYLVFSICVYILDFLGDITFTGYRGINVILFCILLPIYLIYSILELIKRKRIIREMLKELNELKLIINGLEKEN